METKNLTTVRVAKNQATFRETNEKIEAAAHNMEIFGPVPFVCECAEPECTKLIRLTIDEYENVRQHPRRFFVRPGHGAPAIAMGAAVVAEERPGYTLVDKIGVAGEIAEQRHDQRLT
jgi:hypothetical protein